MVVVGERLASFQDPSILIAISGAACPGIVMREATIGAATPIAFQMRRRAVSGDVLSGQLAPLHRIALRIRSDSPCYGNRHLGGWFLCRLALGSGRFVQARGVIIATSRSILLNCSVRSTAF
jgi:hypothetical protein